MRAMALALLSLCDCRTEQTLVTPDPHLERMLKQEKRLAYEDDPILPAGVAMQAPPGGTLAFEAPVGQPLVNTGAADGRWADSIPVQVDLTLLEAGRARFETFCAPCHGVLGDGESVVARKMALRKPPSLHEDRIRAYEPGRIFQTVHEGYGLMPSYAVQISVQDTWAVVAYVQALQLSQNAVVARLPPSVRSRLAKEAP